jgi:hypothetical protein
MLIDGIISVFQSGTMIEWNIRCQEMPVFAERIAAKQLLVQPYGIKGSVAEKSFGSEQRVRLEKIL